MALYTYIYSLIRVAHLRDLFDWVEWLLLKATSSPIRRMTYPCSVIMKIDEDFGSVTT